MSLTDHLALALRALARARLRAALVVVAAAIGVAAVLLFTALGEGAREYVRQQLGALGTVLLQVVPGRSETSGAGPGGFFVGETPRDLTLADALALRRSPAVADVVPMVVGSAPVSWRDRDREGPIIGSTHGLLRVRRWQLAQGRFLPPGDPERAPAVAVIGAEVRRELFGAHPALGEWIRIGDRRFRVIGVLATSGRSIGIDVEKLTVVPVGAAQAIFDTPSLFRIVVEARHRGAVERARRDIVRILRERHQGEEDVTVITQDAVLRAFDRIIAALTYGVAGIAGISLLVAGILVMNVMLVAVAQRKPEIGLLKALGAPPAAILRLFLAEAALLAGLGAALGSIVGAAGAWLVRIVYPALPIAVPAWGVASAAAVSLAAGLLFGALPARRAAALDPVAALEPR